MNGRVGKEYKNSRVISTTTTAKKKNEEDNWPFGGMMTAFLLFDYWNLFDFFFFGGLVGRNSIERCFLLFIVGRL